MQALYNFVAGTLNTVAWIYILLPCVFVGGLYYTIGSGGVQFRRFGYAMKNTLGKIFQKSDAGEGEVTPLQAVTTALAGTVGTGNIVGTSQAIALGGYGAIFWLWLAALLGMVIKYAEVTLSIRYREKDEKGDWVGGPMYYIKNGLGQKWSWLAILFCCFAVLASFGIGNMSQANSINGRSVRTGFRGYRGGRLGHRYCACRSDCRRTLRRYQTNRLRNRKTDPVHEYSLHSIYTDRYLRQHQHGR